MSQSIKCSCKLDNCRAEIVFDYGSMVIRMNPAPSLEGAEPEYIFYLDPNQTANLIRSLRTLMLRFGDEL